MELAATQQTSESNASDADLTRTGDLTSAELEAPPIPDAAAREAEEVRALMVGFATGIGIAFVFLIYLLFEYAKFLP